MLAFEPVVSFARSAAFFIPAGLGVQDAGYMAFLQRAGIPDTVNRAAAFVLLKRFKEVVWIAIGWILLLAARARQRDAAREQAPAEQGSSSGVRPKPMVEVAASGFGPGNRPQCFRGLASRRAGDDNVSAMETPDTRSAERPLEGKVAVVTGALGLLGREHCRALADAGARVVLTDIDGAACARVAPEFGKGALGIGADITSEGSVKALRDQVLAAAGRIDVLVNNAAINDKFEDPAKAAEQSRFEAYPVALFRQSLEVNVTGTFLCAQVLGTEMARAGQGSIINVSSTYGLVAPDQSLYRKPDGTQAFWKTAAYPTTKGAVLALTRFLAAYWGPAGVRVNALCPGGVEAGQDAWFVEAYARRTPLGRMARPDDYRGAVVFLASDASRYMTGTALVVDGGFTAW